MLIVQRCDLGVAQGKEKSLIGAALRYSALGLARDPKDARLVDPRSLRHMPPTAAPLRLCDCTAHIRAHQSDSRDSYQRVEKV